MDDLLSTLKDSATRLDDYRRHHTHLGEENTKAALIEPVLRSLGWNTSDIEEVCREYRRLSNDNPVDYALLLQRTPRLFVEAKDLGANLADHKWANQTISYTTQAGVQWVVLTDGAEWRVFNAHAPVPIEQKLFRTVRIDEDLDGAKTVLELLSKDNMREMRIEEQWKGFFIDRKVHAALTLLFSGSEPAKEIVSAVRHHSGDLKLSEVRESLARVARRVYIEGLEALSDDACYRAMDLLMDALAELQEQVFFSVANLLNLEVDVLFFDTSSTYFELDRLAEELTSHDEGDDQEQEDLVESGIRAWSKHSKDHRSEDRSNREPAHVSQKRVRASPTALGAELDEQAPRALRGTVHKARAAPLSSPHTGRQAPHRQGVNPPRGALRWQVPPPELRRTALGRGDRARLQGPLRGRARLAGPEVDDRPASRLP